MPFKSKKQRAFMFAAEKRGEVPKGTAREWQKETGKKKLPLYAKKRKRKKKKTHA